MKLKVTKVGTHMLPLAEINNDRPSPGEVAHDCMSMLQHTLERAIRTGSTDWDVKCVKESLKFLLEAVKTGEEQGWAFELVTDENYAPINA